MSRIPLFKHSSLGLVTPPALRVRMGKKPVPEFTVESEPSTSTTTLSPSYLSQTSVPSRRIEDPTASRKLLVLDLNGSLLVRPKRSGKGKEVEHASGEAATRTRTVIPRPYIPTFREYISHPRTTSWLDTIVWSSAQPHSVRSMVEKCFGDRTNCLKALMARDTFGLDAASYGRKSLTTKDLEIIWSKGAFTSSPALTSMITAAQDTDAQPFSHSAETTVLVDDSLRKARMQPWNHICIKEYSAGLRRTDLDVWTSLQQPKESKKKKKTKEKEVREEGEVVVALDATVTELAPPQPLGRFDETLLAIIGVLEALKHQNNVSAWIRGGGLLTKGVEMKNVDESLTESPNPLWFDDTEVADAWAAKGKGALEELSIELVHGVHG
ncbi:hypothetical protein V5O48_011322 [Marasmius crinis-equi]|uniref:Mitochondrial import inner membrane translocase subunit TIM50 n=1 Tax=Marasmius crinis-equi TaxID=585013 RepID=A0ABR3F5X9_9AGAR